MKYFVNGEEQTTPEHKLRVDQILERSGFRPIHEYELTRDSDGHTYKHYDQRSRASRG